MMISPQDDSSVYSELWATLCMMKNTGESFPVFSTAPSDGHLFLGAYIQRMHYIYLRLCQLTERLCFH